MTGLIISPTITSSYISTSVAAVYRTQLGFEMIHRKLVVFYLTINRNIGLLVFVIHDKPDTLCRLVNCF